MDPLFPVLPEDLAALSDEDLASSIDEHVASMALIRANDKDFLGDLSAAAIIEQATAGKAALASLRAEQGTRSQAEENYTEVIADLTADAEALAAEAAEGDEGGDGDGDGDAEASDADPGDETLEDEEKEEAAAEGAEALAAAALRRPPAPKKERKGRNHEEEEPQGAVLTASGGVPSPFKPGDELTPEKFTRLMLSQARRLGAPKKSAGGTEEKYLLASAQYQFPPERTLTSDVELNSQKIRALRNTEGGSLVASGGICAPAENIYSIPQFAVTSRPVRDALINFSADRGAVNVPVPTTLASAANAITVITEANDALGGTFATKSCLDQTCLSYVETAVTIISHCREYGNLNARTWPESITFENELTMAEHARVAEGYLLDRIKSLSINVTTADVYSTVHDLIYAITRTVSSIRYILRSGDSVRFRALLPSWVPDMMVSDVAATQFDRFVSRARMTQVLRDAGVEPTYYLDTPSTGTTQGFANETASAVDDFPDVIQFAVFAEGAFIHVNGGSLELGLVRDSTLNSTNDFQMFGETFENVALLAPAQAARWITATVCPSGEFPALTTALSC
jgi:hypothetical protein